MLCSGTDFPQYCQCGQSLAPWFSDSTHPTPFHYENRTHVWTYISNQRDFFKKSFLSLSISTSLSVCLVETGNICQVSDKCPRHCLTVIKCTSTTNIFSLLKTKMEPTTQFEIVVKQLPHRTYNLSHGLFKNWSRNWSGFWKKTRLCILPRYSSLPTRF